jgi:nitrogen-specific signal transduction histidine kinase
MTTMQGSKHYANMMLEHIPSGLAVYDAQELYLLEANTLYIRLLDGFLAEDWRGGNVLGHTIDEWGESASNIPMLKQFQEIIGSGQTSHVQEFALRNEQQEIVYWKGTLQAIQDEQGNNVHFIHSLYDISDQVYARQKAEQDKQALSQAKQMIEAERKQLEIIEAIARSVQDTLDIKRIGEIVVTAIGEQLGSSGVSIHTIDQTQQFLRLLCSNLKPEAIQNYSSTTRSFDKIFLNDAAVTTRKDLAKDDPVVIVDIQEAIRSGAIKTEHPLMFGQARSCIYLPLRFNDRLEGLLSAAFDETTTAESVAVLILKRCATHIAAALAHARLHAAVTHERERLRTILDQVPEGILIVEISTGSFSYANQAAADLLGIPLSNLMDVPLHQHRWHRSAYTSTTSDGQPILPWNFVVVRALCGEQLHSKETLVVQPNGDYIITLASSAPLYDENGIMTGTIIVLQDITAQKSVEQHKNDFLSIANHELRTPITVIQGFAELLQLKHAQEPDTDELTQQALINITEQSEHLTSLIETMFDISRIEQQHFTMRSAPCDLLKIVERAVETHSVTLREHELRFVREGLDATDSLPAHLDKKRINQALHNLINNAVKYSPNGGAIEVGIRYQPERAHEAQIWIKDEGIGISADAQPHIFKRFYRANSLDPSLSGFGIGLYLVKEIVVQHNGHIWVESQKGHGSTFRITLPLQKDVPGHNV